MLTLHRLPRAYRMLYVGIAVFLVAAVWSHWARLGLRHGAGPDAVAAWYRGDDAAMLFPKTGTEVAEDAWMNLFHHTLALLVLGGLLVRTDARPGTKAVLCVLFGVATLMTAAGPPLIWWGIPGSSEVYVLALASLSALTLCALGLVSRDAIFRRSAGHRGLPGSDVLLRGVPLLLLIGVPATSRAQAGVYLSERQALQEVFPEARWIATDTIRPDDSTRAALERRLGRPIESEFVFHRVYAPGGNGKRETGNVQRLSGYTLVTEEKGKYRPITMLIGVDPGGRVAGVRILVYREPRGGEVARQFFLRQYRGKDVGDPIRMNRDIINISGATISVNSVNAAVRKTLALVERYFSPAANRPPDSLIPVSELP